MTLPLGGWGSVRRVSEGEASDSAPSQRRYEICCILERHVGLFADEPSASGNLGKALKA